MNLVTLPLKIVELEGIALGGGDTFLITGVGSQE